jgi:hypothetical protein
MTVTWQFAILTYQELNKVKTNTINVCIGCRLRSVLVFKKERFSIIRERFCINLRNINNQ